MKRALIALVVAANLAVVDAVVKELAAGRLKGAAAVSVIPGLFKLAYVENRGCAWGLFQGHVWPLAAFGVLALGFLIWKRKGIFGLPGSRLGAVAEPLLYAGVVGNLIDRIFRGYVIDMFDFYWKTSHFPCFNVADAFICTAVGLLLLASLVEKPSRPSVERAEG